MINIAEHCSVYYIVSLYKSILTYDEYYVTYLLYVCKLEGLLASNSL